MSWQRDNWRHSLARQGISTRRYWRDRFPELVKRFPGENPRITEDYVRFRQKDPKLFDKFRTKETKNGRKVILGKNKKTGEYELQSVLIPKEGELK
jgi:hypothetical protein